MALNGTGFRLVNCVTHTQGFPGGGSTDVTVAIAPTGNYPALGEPIATIFALANLEAAHIPAGVKPDDVFIGNDNLGHQWAYDPAQGTMGTLRNFTAVSNTPTEHATAAYDGNEASAIFRVTFRFPLFKSMSR